MKGKHKLWQTLIMIALIGFIMTSCGSASEVAPLTLSGQILEFVGNGIHYPSDTLNGTLTSAVSGEGTVTNGQMNFTIGTPYPSVFQSVEEFFHTILDPEGHSYENVVFSVTGAKVAFFSDLEGETETGDAFIVQRVGTNSDDGLFEAVSYVFADRDITITADGRVGEEDYIIVFSNIELRLQRGWNVLHHKINFFEFPFLTTIEVISRDGFPYDGFIWANFPETTAVR